MEQNEFERTILSQYANSTNIIRLLDRVNKCIDPKIDVDRFYDIVHNLDTCDSFGLDVWGIIVAAPRTVKVYEDDWLGFEGSLLQPFNQAPFYAGKRATQSFTMGDEAYRQMIYFKAMINISASTIPDIDRALWHFFQAMGNPGDVYTQRTGIMHMRVVFRFSLTPVERAIFRTYGGLLRPGGVGMDYYEIPVETFGFQGSELMPFNQGIFYAGLINFGTEEKIL